MGSVCDGAISEEDDNGPDGEPATGDTQSTSSQNQSSMRNEAARRKERQRVVCGCAALEPARYGQQTLPNKRRHAPRAPTLAPSTRCCSYLRLFDGVEAVSYTHLTLPTKA